MLHEQAVQQEIVVTSIFGKFDPPGSNLALGISYLLTSKTLVHKQGDTLYAILYLRGNGTVNDLRLSTQGFAVTFITPDLPLKVNSFTDPQIMVMGIKVLQCCYQGNISIILGETA